jgi:hypothetical protein
VLFSNVPFMQVRPGFSRLRIGLEVCLPDFGRCGLPGGAPGNWYVINDGEAHVVATHCQRHEDNGDHHSPSRFGPLRGVE